MNHRFRLRLPLSHVVLFPLFDLLSKAETRRDCIRWEVNSLLPDDLLQLAFRFALGHFFLEAQHDRPLLAFRLTWNIHQIPAPPSSISQFYASVLTDSSAHRFSSPMNRSNRCGSNDNRRGAHAATARL